MLNSPTSSPGAAAAAANAAVESGMNQEIGTPIQPDPSAVEQPPNQAADPGTALQMGLVATLPTHDSRTELPTFQHRAAEQGTHAHSTWALRVRRQEPLL